MRSPAFSFPKTKRIVITYEYTLQNLLRLLRFRSKAYNIDKLKSPAAFSETDNTNPVEQNKSNILIAYVPAKDSTAVEEAAVILRDALGGSLEKISHETPVDTNTYEFVLLGFEAQNSTLPQALQAFLENSDLGARTIYPFVLGEDNDPAAVYSAISQLQPGALLGDSALLFSENTQEQEMIDWAQGLGLSDNALLPETADGNTADTAQVTPQKQQVLYLWEEGNAPAVTEYTVNNRGYFDDQVAGAALDPDYVPDWPDEVSTDAAACGMIYSFYGRLSLGTTDVELLRSGNLPLYLLLLRHPRPLLQPISGKC